MEGLKETFQALNRAWEMVTVGIDEFANAIASAFSKNYSDENYPDEEIPKTKYKRVYKCKLGQSQTDNKVKKHLPYQRRNY